MFNINPRGPIYDPVAVQPMRDELIAAGFKETITPGEVDKYLVRKDNGDQLLQNRTTLVMINSVCGCAAGSARPGVTLALQNKIIPDELITVFAGQDREAVDHLRQNYLKGFQPSSPFFALYKNGELVFVLQRFEIEGKSPEMVADELLIAFDAFCSAKGPSISPEAYAELKHAVMCGSKIPLANNN